MAKKLLDGIERVLRGLVGLGLFITSAVIVIEVFRRYIMGLSFPWSEELVRYILISSCFLGAPSAYRNNQLARLEIISGRLKGKKFIYYEIVIHLIVLLFSAYLACNTLDYALSPSILNQRSTALHLPVVIIYMCIPTGMALMCVFAIEKLVGLVKELKRGGVC